VARNSQAPTGTTPGTELNSTSAGTELNKDSSAGKGRATPTRKEKEAARKRPLVANDRSERRRQERIAAAAQREKQRIGLANGEEKYLGARDRGPQRRYARDYVDARRGVGEVMLPAIALFFISSFFPSDSLVVIAGFAFMWLVLIAAVIDAVIVGSILKRKLAAKFGSVERGVRLYAAMRSVYFRGLRLPKPQVKRGEFPA
jgi:hypothetical protein